MALDCRSTTFLHSATKQKMCMRKGDDNEDDEEIQWGGDCRGRVLAMFWGRSSCLAGNVVKMLPTRQNSCHDALHLIVPTLFGVSLSCISPLHPVSAFQFMSLHCIMLLHCVIASCLVITMRHVPSHCFDAAFCLFGCLLTYPSTLISTLVAQ